MELAKKTIGVHAMLQEGDFVLCTVDRIVGTSVFVKIENDGEGTIVTSEIAPGRIRNLRDYVVPNKKIVCKVLEIEGNNIHLSLRRVSLKEKKEILDFYEKEKTASSILKSVLKEKAAGVIEKLKQENLYIFLQNCKTNPAELEKLMSKEQASQVCKILQEKKEKLKEIKREFKLTSNAEDGLIRIKKILVDCNCEITYLGSGKYVIKNTSTNIKEADKAVSAALEKIEKQTKSAKADFEIIEKKK